MRDFWYYNSVTVTRGSRYDFLILLINERDLVITEFKNTRDIENAKCKTYTVGRYTNIRESWMFAHVFC